MRFDNLIRLVALASLPACGFCQGQSAGIIAGASLPQWAVGQPVRTTSGTIIGHAARNKTSVSEYLGIPFAEPPVGELRFAAPRSFYGRGNFTASTFSPDCPANLVNPDQLSPLLPRLALPQALTILSNFGQLLNNQSEDCLTLNIWTKPQSGSSKKAVMVWIPGGGFSMGTSNNPAYNGQYFADSEDVVLVSINYRVNIFGFPGLKGTNAAQNPGLLDQRMAIEWIERNIAGFGGDPQRITLSGESAGATSVDLYQYAWRARPIVNAFIQQSGTAQAFQNPAPPDNIAYWYNASQTLGCGGSGTDLEKTLVCVRTKPFQQILAAIRSPDPLRNLLGNFLPSVDHRVVFADYTARGKSGQFIQKPLLIGNNFNEAGFFKILAWAGGHNITEEQWALFNQGLFQCPTASAAQYRAENGVDVYRYLYFGDFPNLRVTNDPPSGAYHTSEIPIAFETSVDTSGVANTRDETLVSRYMNAAWAAFAKDPQEGLQKQQFRLPKYNTFGLPSLMLLAANNSTIPHVASAARFDALCPILDFLGSLVPGGLPALITAPFQNSNTMTGSASQSLESMLDQQGRQKLSDYMAMLAGKIPIVGGDNGPQPNNPFPPQQPSQGLPPPPNTGLPQQSATIEWPSQGPTFPAEYPAPLPSKQIQPPPPREAGSEQQPVSWDALSPQFTPWPSNLPPAQVDSPLPPRPQQDAGQQVSWGEPSPMPNPWAANSPALQPAQPWSPPSQQNAGQPVAWSEPFPLATPWPADPPAPKSDQPLPPQPQQDAGQPVAWSNPFPLATPWVADPPPPKPDQSLPPRPQQEPNAPLPPRPQQEAGQPVYWGAPSPLPTQWAANLPPVQSDVPLPPRPQQEAGQPAVSWFTPSPIHTPIAASNLPPPPPDAPLPPHPQPDAAQPTPGREPAAAVPNPWAANAPGPQPDQSWAPPPDAVAPAVWSDAPPPPDWAVNVPSTAPLPDAAADALAGWPWTNWLPSTLVMARPSPAAAKPWSFFARKHKEKKTSRQ